MKRITFQTIILLLMLVCTGGLQAGVRSVEEAMAIAGRFMAESQNDVSPAERTRRAMVASLDAEPVELVYTQMQYAETEPALYVFNHTEQGYVIVSAHDATRPILGYSTESTVSEEDMPANMRAWLQMYADEIARLTDKASVSFDTSVEYYPTIEPLLGNTAWNQSAPYNDHCPIDPNTNERSVTGCMATATAQVMYHHKYPVTGMGDHSYYWRGKKLSVDFSQATYDWANMLPTYKPGMYSKVESDAVAQLMYHLGVACNMDYSSSASGAGMGTSMAALINYFDYDAGIKVLKKDYMDEDDIMAEIAADLEASRPIQIEALTKKREGHAFVCDGMQSNGYIHINWGWGGYADGYFALSVMNPTNQGIGGASDNGAFTESVTLYVGVQPNKGGVSVPVMLATNVEMTSAAALSKQEKIAFKLTEFQNGGVGQEHGHVAYLLYKDSALYQSVHTNLEWTLKPMYYHRSADVNASLSNVEVGAYELVVGVDVTDKSVYPLYVYNQGVKRYTMTVTSDSIFLEEIIKKSEFFGLEYATMRVTDLSVKTGCNNLRVVLQTEDFELNTKGQVKSGTALSFDLFPSEVTSVIGSYAIDMTNTQVEGTMSSTFSKVMSVEDGKQINENMTAGVVTIRQVIGGHYVISYDLKSDNYSFVGACKITDGAVKCYKQSSNGTTAPYVLTSESVTAMRASDACAWVSGCADEELSFMPFYVRGMVSKLDAVPTEAGGANFYISDNGSSNSALFCYEAKWLGNTDFVTGNELSIKDTVMMVGYLQQVNQTTPTLHGYAYDYRTYNPNTNSSVDNVAQGTAVIRAEGLCVTVSCAHACETYIYDVLGRVVAAAPAATKHVFELPAEGCYVVRCGSDAKKIIIK